MKNSVLIFLLCFSLPAQQFIGSMPATVEPVPQFPQQAFFRQGFGRELPRVEIQPPVRLQDFVVGDKLELSLRSFIELVLANHPDIQIQRLTIQTFKNAIQRSYGRFDPSITTSFNATRSNSPTDSILQGAATLSTLTQPFNSFYNQTLENGTQFTVGFATTKTSTNNSFATFNPSLSSNMRVGFTQPLLRDRGVNVNRLQIATSRSRYRQAEYNINDRMLDILQRAELAYWAAIQAREVLKVQENALNVNGVLLKRNQRELELGAISALEIYQPQQNYAQTEVAVTQARYQLEQSLDAIRRQIGADVDPQFRNIPIELTETVLPPSDDTPLDKERYVESAFRNRPDLKSQLQNLDIDDLAYRTAKNRLLPDLSLTGNYTAAGRGGNFIPRTNNLGSGVPLATRLIPGGLPDALNQVFGFDFPTYAMGLTLRLPLRDRVGQADLADAAVSKKVNTFRIRSLEQDIRLLVLNAVTQVESSRAGVKQSQITLDFAQKRLDAEQKRYDLGVTTIFFVIQAQQDLVSAQASLVTQSLNYRRAQLSLLRQTATLLEERGIVIQ